MKIEFENFVVDDDGILINGNYRIDTSQLWETRKFKGVLLWNWLIHLTDKEWITSENVGKLNTAFFLAQDLFKNQKPINTNDASIAQTLYVQKQKLDIKGRDLSNTFNINVDDDNFEYEEIELLIIKVHNDS